MTEDQAKSWVKDKTKQQSVVDRFFIDHEPRETKQAVFMAGIPGAGKTEFAENLNKAIKFLPIEHDKLVEYIEGYEPEKYYNFRKAGSILVSRILDECLKRGYGFVFDGTLSHEGGYRNIERALKKGYGVQIIYVVQDARTAWQLTQDRELVKKRAIEMSGFISTCNKINDNLSSIFNRFKDHQNFTFILLDKNGHPGTYVANTLVYAKFLSDTMAFDDSLKIEKALKKSYNLTEIG